MMEAVYLHDWADVDGLMADFDIGPEVLEGCEILLASYTYQDYQGDAFVLFRKDGQLFEVNGGHCSCYGLGGQWDPEETSVLALEIRFGDDFHKFPELGPVINALGE